MYQKIYFFSLFVILIFAFTCSEDPTSSKNNPNEPIPDTNPPSVAIIAPVDGAMVSDTVNIVAQASDNVGITKLEIVIDSNLYETLISSPWQCEWDVTSYTDGSTRRLNAVAYDSAGNKTTSDTVTVEISNSQSLVDTIPPAAITDLIVSEEMANSLTLSWTSPGDDESTGTAQNYELKYSTSMITEQNYSQANNYYGLPSPQPSGQNQTHTVSGLMAAETYYFAIKTRDEVQNISGLSNIAIGTTKAGMFTSPIAYPLVSGSYPSAESIVSADFDGDGDYDIAAAANVGMSVVLSDGTGAFGEPVSYNLGTSTRDIVSGDFDSDGDNDLAVAFAFSSEVGVTIMLNPGNGNFQEASTYSLTSMSREICTADLNADGHLDLAIAHDNFSGGVLDTGADVLLGNGDGTFQPAVNYGVGGSPRSVSAGDFDGDNDNDLVVSCYNAEMVWVLWNTGNGIFQKAVNVLEGRFGDHSNAVLAADFNADGYYDIAATNDYPDYVNILLGNDDGTFEFKGSTRVGNSPRALAMADFDGDGITDLVTQNNSDPTVSVILGNGDGSFQNSLYFHVETALWDICTGDYDLDGDFDLAVLRDYRIFILLNTTIN